ncbi:hypothetical protein [Paraburkholderia pallida]|uniref:hypothetical protein n=1 Tax=Paraburkholderia pallida TaxID=2547399 RepID=UPI0014321A2E|nr:hypothetical protein [Paraburkholderia pallida]
MREIEWAWREKSLDHQAQTHECQTRQQDPMCHPIAIKGEPESQYDTHGRAKRTGATECENLGKIWPEHWTGPREADFPVAETHPDQGSEH